jgi:GDP-L-fucose synthase
MKKKVLICGATGFLGRNLVEFYVNQSEYDVYGTFLTSIPYDEYPSLTLVKADLRNKNDVERVVKGMDVIIQAAATTSGAKDITNSPAIHVTDNAIMNSLIFRAAHELKVPHLIFFSCTVMYQPSEQALKETDFNANDEIYPAYFGVGWTKVYLEKQAEFYSRLNHTKYTIIRHSNIYGPHDKYDLEKSHVFGATMTKVMTNKDGNIVVWGTGEAGRDLIYIDDLINFVNLAVLNQKEKFELVNIGIGKAIQVKDLVQKIIDASGKSIKIEFDLTKPNFTTKLALDCTKADENFGWRPQISLEEGIKKTMEWYRKNVIINK